MRILVFLLSWMVLCSGGGAQTLHRGNGPEPDSLDIHLAQGLSAHNILRDLYDGLAEESTDGEGVRPAAAAQWIWNDDRTRLTVTLRPDGRWVDGQPVTAADFVHAWRRAVAPTTAAPYARIFDVVVNGSAISRGEQPPEDLGISASDDLTLVIDLVRPASEFPRLLALPVTFPYRDDPSTRVMGNGRYRLSTWVPQSHVDLVRSDHHPLVQQTAIEHVRYHSVEDADAELKRFRAGELHITETVPPGRMSWIKKNLNDALRIAPYYGSYFLGYNLTRAPFDDAPTLRRALNLAIDRQVLAEKVLGAGQRPALGVVPPTADWPPYANALDGLSKAERLAQAKTLFKQARLGSGAPLEVEIRVNSGVQHRRLAVAIAAMWKQALGVKTHIVREEWKVFVQNRRSRANTQVFRWGWIGDYRDPLTFLELFESGSSLNASGYRNEAYDALIDRARVAPDAARIPILREAEAMLMADAPVIPLYYYVSQHLVSPQIRGWQDNVLDRHPSATLSFAP